MLCASCALNHAGQHHPPHYSGRALRISSLQKICAPAEFIFAEVKLYKYTNAETRHTARGESLRYILCYGCGIIAQLNAKWVIACLFSAKLVSGAFIYIDIYVYQYIEMCKVSVLEEPKDGGGLRARVVLICDELISAWVMFAICLPNYRFRSVLQTSLMGILI